MDPRDFLQHAVSVNLNTVDVQLDTVADGEASSPECTDQHPESRVILATAKRQPANSSQVAGEKSVTAAVAAPKSNGTAKHRKRDLSSGHFLEPHSKRQKHDQKLKRREKTSAVWTESLFVSEPSEVGRDTLKVTSAADTQERNCLPSSVAASSVVTSPSLVRDDKRKSQQNFVPSEIITAVDTNPIDTSVHAGSGQTLIAGDGVFHGITDDTANSASLSSVGTHLLNSVPAVQCTLLRDFRGSTQESSSFANVQIARTTLPVSLSPSSNSSEHSAQARPTCNISMMHTTIDGQNLSVRPASNTASCQQHCVDAVSSATSQNSRQSHSPSQPRPLLSKSVVRVVLPPQNTRPRFHSGPVHDKLLTLQTCVQSDRKFSSEVKPQCAEAPCVRQSTTSLSASAPQHCVVSTTGVQPQTLSPVAGMTDFSPRASSTVLRSVPTQPIRIRVNAAALGNPADPAALMNHVRGLLSRTNVILPGAQIRIRYMPPSTTSSQTACPSDAAQTATSEHVNTRISQLDGTDDDVDEDGDDAEMVAVKPSENTSLNPADVASNNVSTVCSTRRRAKAAEADEQLPSDSRVR